MGKMEFGNLKLEYLGKRDYEVEFASDLLNLICDNVCIFRRDSVLSGCVGVMFSRLEEISPSVRNSLDIDYDYVCYFSDVPDSDSGSMSADVR